MKNLDNMLENVSVIGGAGKMGRGIAALLAIEMINTKIRTQKEYTLNLVDINYDALEAAIPYIETIAKKWAEKSSPDKVYVNVEEYVKNVKDIVRIGDISLAKNSKMIFEAIFENEEMKIEKLKELKKINKNAVYFTNTSAIPIKVLNKGAKLKGNIIGYHFYNPPPAQKLLELITNEKTNQSLITIGKELAGRLGKTVVEANDIAGFIGNGHFMRECINADKLVKFLTSFWMDEHEAIFRINEVTKKYLIRPMGIFQLMDYVGVDVVQNILKVMNTHIKEETLASELVDRYMRKGVKGGQNPDGSQKNGFLKYEQGRIVGVYDAKKEEYRTFEEEWCRKAGKEIKDEMPKDNLAWKELFKDKEKDAKLKKYFTNLASSDTESAYLANLYLIKSARATEKLVTNGIAKSIDDVTKVLKLGFAHLYNPKDYTN